eukprot:g2492.t1
MDEGDDIGRDLVANASPGCRSFLLGLLSYSSVKYVHIDARSSFWPVLSFRVLQIAILAYIVLFTIVMQKQYNEIDEVVAESFSKMKGAANMTQRYPNGTVRHTIVDANDLVTPPLMENAIFITTSMVSNHEFADTTCPDLKKECENADDCSPYEFVQYSNDGMYTGQCVSAPNTQKKYCQVRGWCAVNDTYPRDPDIHDVSVDGVDQWSLFVRLNAEFPAFDKKMNTAPEKLIPGRNQWLIKDILAGAGVAMADIRDLGAIVLMKATFNCDFNTQDRCDPSWEFSRLDKTYPTQSFSTGYNYYEKVYISDTERYVNKRYGLKLEINVSGRGGQFSIVALTIALGSGIGLLSVASLVTDFLLQHVCKSKKYIERKFDDLEHLPNDAPRKSTRGMRVKDEDGDDDDDELTGPIMSNDDGGFYKAF